LVSDAVEVARIVLPVFALVALGVLARRSAFPGEAFWPPAERVTYFAFFPALIATTLAEADLSGTPWPRMAIGIAGAIGVVTVAVFAARRAAALDGPRFTSLYQGAVRMNTYLGLAIAARWAGAEGIAYAAVAISVIVPLVNLTSVAALARHGARGEAAPSVAWSVATNPLILATALGVALNLSRVGSPPVVGEVATLLGRAALPLGLLTVGASLRWEAAVATRPAEAVVTVVKLLVLPALAGVALHALGVGGVALAVGVLFTALPTAPSAYLLARQMGGDADTMAALIALQTIASLLTLPLVLACVM